MRLGERIGRGCGRRLFGKRAGAGVYDVRRLQILRTDVRLGQQHIRAGLACKGEAAVAVRVQRDEGHGCGCLARQLLHALRHAVFLQRVHQEVTEIVVADHAAERGPTALTGCGNGDVGRCAAGLADVACGFTAGKKVNDHLADAKNVCHIRSSSANSFHKEPFRPCGASARP